MLIVAGSFTLAPEDRDAFLQSREAAMRTSRAEPGCIDYVFSADPLDETRVVLFERWEDKASLAAHQAAMRAAREQGGGAAPASPPVKVLSSEIAQYEISATGPVGS
jgi:quinol monooxygenase YgiN